MTMVAHAFWVLMISLFYLECMSSIMTLNLVQKFIIQMFIWWWDTWVNVL